MGLFTARRKIRFPVLGDSPNAPLDMQHIAEDLDNFVIHGVDLLSARPVPAAGPGHDVGMPGTFFTASDTHQHFISDGASWYEIACLPLPIASVFEGNMKTGANGMCRGSFSAWHNAGGSLVTDSVVVFDMEEWDISGWYDNTNGKFQPLTAGIYRLSAAVRSNSTSFGQVWQAYIAKNGIAYKSFQQYAAGGSPSQAVSEGSALVAANGTTDYFQIKISHDHGSAVPIYSDAIQTTFQSELVGRT